MEFANQNNKLGFTDQVDIASQSRFLCWRHFFRIRTVTRASLIDVSRGFPQSPPAPGGKLEWIVTLLGYDTIFQILPNSSFINHPVI
jgi:hypothetical protein